MNKNRIDLFDALILPQGYLPPLEECVPPHPFAWFRAYCLWRLRLRVPLPIITIFVTRKQLDLIILAVEEQHDAQVDEVRDAKPRSRKKAERELAEWGELLLNLGNLEEER